MKQIFTLVIMGMLCLASNKSNAQVNETFSTPVPSCWLTTNVDYTKINQGINGISARLLNVAASELGTPYIDVTSGTVAVSFNYALSGNLQAGKTRTITVGYQNKAGVFTALSSIINVTSTNTINFTNTYSVPNGIFRIVIKGATDGANDKVLIDDLSVTGNSFHYGATPCNPNPTVNNDSYTSTTGTYATVLSNDTDPNNESLTAELVANSVDGNVVLNADGTFTFIPNAGFTGTKTTFTYRALDNGFDPAYSATNATVTINMAPSPVILPIHILSFQGTVNKDKAQLTWSVADNETGSFFEVQKSADGKKFENVTTMFTTDKVGNENYSYTDANTNTAGVFYKLKIFNKDNSTSFSKVVYLKAIDATTNKIVLLQNPVQSTLSFSFSAAAAETNEIAVYNMIGVKVYSQKMMAQKGTNTITTDCNNKLSTGNYILQISNASGSATIKFVKY